MYDPIGPGTPAWNNFDNAVEAWQSIGAADWSRGSNRGKDPRYKRYHNCRQEMIRHVRKHNGDVEAWCKQLDLQKTET